MNKCILIIAFALLAVIVFVQCNNDDAVVEEVKTQFDVELPKKNLTKIKRKYLRLKERYLNSQLGKVEKHCPGAEEKVKLAIHHFEECVETIDETLTLCSMAESLILNCSIPLFKVGDECLPERSKGVPILVAKVMYSAVDYMCEETGEILFEFFNPCMWSRWMHFDVDDDDDDEDSIKPCREKIHSIHAKYRANQPSKSEICSDATSFRSCLDVLVSTPCKNPKTRHAFLGLYDAMLAPCSNITEA